MNPNSMYIWLPKVQEAGIPHPRTVMIEASHEVLSPMVDGEPIAADLLDRLETAAVEFGFPLFLRTDLASGKHNWRRSCFVPSKDAFLNCLFGVVEANDMADIFGLPFAGIALREFLRLDSTFTAFQGMPVAAERRYFAEQGRVLCHHSYWIEDSIRSWAEPLPTNWRDLLAELNDESSDPSHLAEWASAVTKLLPGAWSVDFAHLTAGGWVLLDMALAGESWHPEHH